MKLSPEQLAREARAGRFSPVYFFLGDDDYRMNEAIHYLIDSFLPDQLRASNVTRIDLNSARVDALHDALAALPFFGERTVVTVIDPQRLNAKHLDTTLALLKPAVSERLVIFYTRAAHKPKKTISYYKKLEANSALVEFPRLRRNDSARRVGKLFKEADISAEADTISQLVEMTGGDMGRLLSETDKLMAYVGPGGAVTGETVRSVCSEGARRTVKDVSDVVVAGPTAGALAALGPLMSAGESATGILFWLGTHFLDLYLIQGGRSLPPYKMNKSWLVSKLKSQSRAMSVERLESAIALISRYEALLKGGAGASRRQRGIEMAPREALFELTMSLCQLRAASAGAPVA
ncbi:MAG: DNA polymerase III subunit delta [Candidatus Zixiibacteriota bacterium]